VYWSRANDNGAKPVYYTLEGREASAEASEHFHRLYYGIECGFVVANLKSNTTYLFRLKSENHVGETSWIESKSVKTSVHVRPEIMELTRAEKNATYDRWVVCWDPKTEQIFYFNKFTCQRQIEEPPEVLEARQQKGLLGVEETPEMLFRRKRFRFHRDLRASVPSATLSTIVPIEISRDQIFEDTLRIFTAVMSTKQQLLCKPKISFLNEPGIDSGGLTKDWYLQVSKAILDSSRKLFKPADQGFYEFHPGGDVKSMRFIGKFIAKAIFDRQTLDLPLCEMIWKQMMGVNVSQNGGMEELKAIDAQYHKSLQWMLENDVTNVIDETFSVEDPTLGIVDLKENGREIAVSESNKKEYVQLLVQWRLEFSIQRQFQALIQGFGTLIPLTQLKSFELEEFKMLVNGKPTIDIEELRASTVFQGGYHENAQVVLWLWQALREFDQQKRGLFLKFMTGTNKIPLDGFEPPLNLTKSDLDPKALPRTHTCFNQLVLPEYPTYDILVEKITFAIMNAEGFELS
jgi:E3 ubiquitin-protein ligase HUWE1